MQAKQKGSQDIITRSIKKDKLAWLFIPKNYRIGLQKQLLLIRQHGINYTNSASLVTALNKFDKKIEKIRNKKVKIRNVEQLISIAQQILHIVTQRQYQYVVQLLVNYF